MKLVKMTTGSGYCRTCKKHIKNGNNAYSDGNGNYSHVGCFELKPAVLVAPKKTINIIDGSDESYQAEIADRGYCQGEMIADCAE